MPQNTETRSEAVSECLTMLQQIIDCVAAVEDDPEETGIPQGEASQNAIMRIRDMLHAYETRHGLSDDAGAAADGQPDGQPDGMSGDSPAEAPPVPPVPPLTAGPGPYNVALVSSNGIGAALYRSPEPVATEEGAVELVLREAERLKLHVDHEAVRHWITGFSEHMVDFGDWGVYGVITSVADQESGK